MTELIISLALLGIILMGLEFFVIPGFGISGVLGIVALIAAIVLASGSLLQGIVYTLLTLMILGVLLYLSFRSPQTNKLWKKLSLSTRQTNQEGYVAPKPDYERFVGQKGVALSPLRPAGTADFCGERLDVVTEGDFITKGAQVKIVSVEGTRIIVREDRSEHC
ncbi:MAG TPA: NfeD family protein [Verrucomicrobiae bacterium]|nr:NfeD family protein [Verrucomicrobiae bacterium]